MMQMSLTGEIPLTRDNILKVVREQGPITEIDLLKDLGHEVNVEQLNALGDVVKGLCKEGEMCLSVFLVGNVYYHKFHIGKHPEACCAVRGYEPDEEED